MDKVLTKKLAHKELNKEILEAGEQKRCLLMPLNFVGLGK